MTGALIGLTVPPGTVFADLKLARDASGDVSFSTEVIKRVCDASGIDPAFFLAGDEDRLSALIIGWYRMHRDGGGPPDPVAEDLLAEVRAEDQLGGGISHPPGRA